VPNAARRLVTEVYPIQVRAGECGERGAILFRAAENAPKTQAGSRTRGRALISTESC
jgi:hypothetical protein